MNKKTEALKMNTTQAIDFLYAVTMNYTLNSIDHDRFEKAVDVLAKALEQPAQGLMYADVIHKGLSGACNQKITEQPNNMVTVPLDKLQDMQRMEGLSQPAQEPVMIEDCNAARQIKEWHEKNTHPAPSEPFIGGSVCPSCGNHSLFKTDKSEWCVTHKCLWQSDYPPSWQGLSSKEIDDIVSYPWGETKDWVRAIEAKLKDKNT